MSRDYENYTEFSLYAFAFENNVITTNELRRLMGLDPRDDGDRLRKEDKGREKGDKEKARPEERLEEHPEE